MYRAKSVKCAQKMNCEASLLTVLLIINWLRSHLVNVYFSMYAFSATAFLVK